MRFPNGYGSVYRLKGNRRCPYVARKTTGWTFDEEGHKSFPVYKFIGFYSSAQEAMTALTEWNKTPDQFHFENMTFEELYEKWSAEHFPEITHKLTVTYKTMFNLCSEIHKTRLMDIRLDNIQKIADESGKNKPTLKNLKSLLGLMFDYAVTHEYVPSQKREMVKALNIEKGNPNSRDHHRFTTDEIDRIWKMHDQNPYLNLILIQIYTGCRINELLDLKKEDVHFDERWFFVRKSKTKSGIREVPIAEKIVPFVEQWMMKDSDFLICTETGIHCTYRNYLDVYWTPMMELLGMETHKPHDTRHTCISMLAEAKVDKRWITQIVGHSGQGVTEGVYTHIDLPHKLEAINKI